MPHTRESTDCDAQSPSTKIVPRGMTFVLAISSRVLPSGRANVERCLRESAVSAARVLTALTALLRELCSRPVGSPYIAAGRRKRGRPARAWWAGGLVVAALANELGDAGPAATGATGSWTTSWRSSGA